MNLVLIGYRGTGKSTIAQLLAERLGWRLISLDAEIAQKAQHSIPEIVEQFGWDHFRQLESEICQTAAQQELGHWKEYHCPTSCRAIGMGADLP